MAVTYGEAPSTYEIRTVSSPALEPLTGDAEPAVTNTCSITADVHLYPTDYANKVLESCLPLSAADTQKKKVILQHQNIQIIPTLWVQKYVLCTCGC